MFENFLERKERAMSIITELTCAEFFPGSNLSEAKEGIVEG